jgi:Protein of unknown function (DUF1203)
MSFLVRGLAPQPFRHLFGLDEAALAQHGVQRHIVDKPHAFPDRVELRDGVVGETMLLLNYQHQPADTPYRASHAIFVREGAMQAAEYRDEVPEVMQRRVVSLRAFDAQHLMVDADLASGEEIAALIVRLFGNAQVAYIQAHYARRGCYAAHIGRA